MKKAFLLAMIQLLSFGCLAQKPEIESFTPAQGEIGSIVTITGTGFGATAADNIVFFGAVRAEMLTVTTTQLTVQVPNGVIQATIRLSVNQLTTYSQQTFTPLFKSVRSILSTSFAPQVDFTTSGNPHSLSMEDIDADALPDIVYAHHQPGLPLLHNKSNRGTIDRNSLTGIVLSAAGTLPSEDVAFGDVNGDGKTDMVALDITSFQVKVYENIHATGLINDASFAPAISISTRASDTRNLSFQLGGGHIFLEDIDNDGKPDLLIKDFMNEQIMIRRNIHTGGRMTSASFDEEIAVRVEAGRWLSEMAVADLNGDGKKEIITSSFINYNIVQDFKTIKFAIYEHTGQLLNAESFQPRLSFTTNEFLYNIKISDVNADGKPDIAFFSSNVNKTPIVSILINKGFREISDTSFASAIHVEFAKTVSLSDLLFHDLNGDGKSEMMVTTLTNEATLSIYEHKSTSEQLTIDTYQNPVNFKIGNGPSGVIAGDIDADGRPDLVVAVENKISILRNQLPLPVPRITASPVFASVGTSVIITGKNFSTTANDNLVYFGAAKAAVTGAAADPEDSSQLALTVTVPAGTTYSPISVSVDGLTGYSRLPFYNTFPSSQKNDVAFRWVKDLPLSATGSITYGNGMELTGITLADIDGDSKIDIASPIADSIVVFKNTSTYGNIPQLSFASAVSFPLADPADTGESTVNFTDILATDVDGDGWLDLITGRTNVNTSLQLATVLRNATHAIAPDNFTDKQNIERIFQRPLDALEVNKAVSGDIDGDGKTDLVVLTNTFPSARDGRVSVFRNISRNHTASFSFEEEQEILNDFPVSQIKLADIDNDGKEDIVLGVYRTGILYILKNRSVAEQMHAQSFNEPTLFITANEAEGRLGTQDIETADIDGDGWLDILVLNSTSRSVTLLHNAHKTVPDKISSDAFTNYIFPLNLAEGIVPTDMTLGDVDGDGKLDIMVTSDNSQQVTYLRNTGRGGAVTPASYNQKQDFKVEGFLHSIALGDVDGDGKPEMIIKRSDQDGKNLMLSIFRNTIKPPKPTITTVEPEVGAGPGDTLVLGGTNFIEVQSVSFGGIEQPQFTVDSRNQITLTVPQGALSDSIVVTTTGGNASSAPFTAISPADAIAGNTTVCQQSTEVEYFTAPIAGALAYQWTLPKGASIISGTNTNSIVVAFDATTQQGINVIQVQGVAGTFKGKASPAFSVRVDSTPAAPLNLVAKSAPDGAAIHLTWQAYPADNTANFFIERAENSSENFLQISIRPPNENSFIDNTVTAGTTYYYRIRARLNPCFSRYSNTTGAATAANVFTTGTGLVVTSDKIKLFPNPSESILYIEVDDPGTEHVSIQISTLVGIIKKQIKYRISVNQSTYACDISDLEAGVYFVTIDSKKSRTIKKIIKL